MKHCKRCKRTKPLDQFSLGGKDPDGHQSWCKQCFKDRYQVTKARHCLLVAERKRVVRRQLHDRMRAYLESHPCVDCGIRDLRVLEFDHHSGEKIANVATLMADLKRWEIIEKEIAKCDVVCANCHSIRTVERAGGWRSLGVVA